VYVEPAAAVHQILHGKLYTSRPVIDVSETPTATGFKIIGFAINSKHGKSCEQSQIDALAHHGQLTLPTRAAVTEIS
jgi:hypothetical protein